jgi:ParB family chromosome partitioning protein
MSKDKPRRLGRGLESLISFDRPAAEASQDGVSGDRRPLQNVPLDRISPNPFQPRRNFDDAGLKALADSIRQSGLLQPLLVRRRGDRFELIAGERRLRAARLAGTQSVPVIVREADDGQMLPLALVENLLRADLNPIERAEAYRRCCTEFRLAITDLAERIGEDRSTVSNFMRLLELPASVRSLVETGRLSAGHARCLLGIADASRQSELADRATNEDWSVRQLEEAAKREKAAPDAGAKSPAPVPVRRPQIADLESRLSETVGVRVRIREGRRPNSGKLVIEYASLDDFDRILERLGVALAE